MKKIKASLFFALALSLGAPSLLHAASPPPVQLTKTKQELLQDLAKVTKVCGILIQTVDGRACLWKWKWHHGKCLSAPIKCRQLHVKEQQFRLQEYNKTMDQLKDFVTTNATKIKTKIENTPLTQQLVSDVSQETQSLSGQCVNLVRSLQQHQHLAPIEKLYKEIFGKSCK